MMFVLWPEHFPPEGTFLSRPEPSSLPTDQPGREIAVFLHEHPNLNERFGPIDLATMSGEEKVSLLTEIRSVLRIRPILRTHLGYVGP